MREAASLTRRQWLGATALGALGLNLGTLLHARAAAEPRLATRPQGLRACILLYQYGGPSHLDTFDLKPDAPAEIRGEFQPIATTVPGLDLCELMPRLAKLADRLT